jgi:hypothetical protein
VDWWVVKIFAVGLYVALLNPTAANAQAVGLRCTIGGEEAPASFAVDEKNKTINTGKAKLPAQINARTITWREDGVLRVIEVPPGEQQIRPIDLASGPYDKHR